MLCRPAPKREAVIIFHGLGSETFPAKLKGDVPLREPLAESDVWVVLGGIQLRAPFYVAHTK